MTNPLDNLDPDFTSPDKVSGVSSNLSSDPAFQLVSLYNLIALSKEAEDHINQGHKIHAQKSGSQFCVCSCGQSFRVGIIVDKRTLL